MVHDNEGYILYPAGYPEHKIRRIHSRKSHSSSHHAFMYKSEASSSRQSIHVKLPKKKSPIASNEQNISFKTFDASYVLTNKSGKIVAKYVGGKHKGSKTCVWVPKVLVSNVKGPKTVCVTPRPIPGPAVLTPGSSLGSYIVPTDQHVSFVHTLSSLMRTRENFPVGHPSQIAPSQARLTWRFFRDRLPKKKMHLVGMNTLSILLSLGPGNHHPRGQDITIHPP
jgi:hypothetical protein